MKLLVILALLGSLTFQQDPTSRQPPSAVVADPVPDPKYPPTLVGLTIPSHGVDLDALFYLAAGAGPHRTVLLLYGLPGYETNGDLAQSIRRAGWNVLQFHYRGTWRTDANFSFGSAIEDTASAVRFLRDPSHASQYRIDPHHLVLIGKSFGGFLAACETSRDPDIAAVAMIAAVNLGTMNADPKQREIRLQRWKQQSHPVHGSDTTQLFAEAAQHAKDWDYRHWADSLGTRPILIVQADDQNRDDLQALAAALRNNHAKQLDEVALPTDHSFSDHRIALQSIVIDWLSRLETVPH
jgi:alpha/beta superfamily hydrolase